MVQDPVRAEGLTLIRADILVWGRGRSGGPMDSAVLCVEGERAGAKVWILVEVIHNPDNADSPWREMILLDDLTQFRRVFDHSPSSSEMARFLADIRWDGMALR